MVYSSPISLWEKTASEPDVTRSGFAAHGLPDRTIDVAIVGGGFTGLSTALHCASAGLEAHVIEARAIGFGGSGRNVGLVNAGIWLPPSKVRQSLGPDYGPRFLRRFSDGPQAVFDLIERYQIRCEATRTGTIHAAHAPSGFRALRTRHGEWRDMGEPVDLLGPGEVAGLTGSAAFHGGLLDHRAGTINPVGYVRGLARAARAAGAGLSIGVQVKGLERDGDHWRVRTDAGDLKARTVVLATNAYTDSLWPGLRDGQTVIHYFQIATEHLGARADDILPGRQGLWNTAPIMFSFRKDADNRLLIGSMGRILGTSEDGITQRFARKRLQALYPALGDVRFETAWHGRIAMTPDHLPRIHQLAEGLWTPIGYNGRGITTGTLFGQAMADLLTGMDPMDLPLPVSIPRAARGAGLKSRVFDLAFSANQIWKGLF
ncbi:MAG: FAD-binding oxidoreductase [Pseudomonadota bacterium]